MTLNNNLDFGPLIWNISTELIISVLYLLPQIISILELQCSQAYAYDLQRAGLLTDHVLSPTPMINVSW
jgi:hypothetical protein